ncbi:MAG: radical SAM protein [Planctomycetes bacterium]|nr:radical SAM protein [Planctomycetota bacterium]
MSRYRVVALVELTGACQTRCAFCARDARASTARPMTETTFLTVLRRLRPRDVRHAELAGFGEPLLHPRIEVLLGHVAGHAVPFRLCTNGEQLDRRKLGAIDGVLERVIVPLTAADEALAARLQPGLDHERVLENLRHAARMRRTRLEVAVPALPECLDALPDTVARLRALGVRHVGVSTHVHVHGGALDAPTRTLESAREIARRRDLPDSGLDRVPPLGEILESWRTARCRCVPRNASLLIDTQGRFHDCFQDAVHEHVLGHVDLMTLREAVEERERRDAPWSLCETCALRDGFGPGELALALRDRDAGDLPGRRGVG